jgi:hypothetical protein
MEIGVGDEIMGKVPWEMVLNLWVLI